MNLETAPLTLLPTSLAIRRSGIFGVIYFVRGANSFRGFVPGKQASEGSADFRLVTDSVVSCLFWVICEHFITLSHGIYPGSSVAFDMTPLHPTLFMN